MGQEVYKEQISNLEYLKVDHGADKNVILLHGYGASMYDLYPLVDYLDPFQKFNWYFPNAPIVLNMGFGMMSQAWFPIDMAEVERCMALGTHRDFAKAFPNEFEDSLNKLENFISGISCKELVIGGFSQGAMLSSHLAPKLSADILGMVLFSGNLLGQDYLVKLLEKSKKFPFFQSHGRSDNVLGFEYAKALFELLKLGGHPGEFFGFDGGHEIPMSVIEKSKKFLETL